MRALRSFVGLTLRARTRRVLWLIAFGLLFVAAAGTARIVAGDEHGHLEMDQLFQLGGTTLVSALLLLGWLIGRFPIIAVLVLMHGMFSDDRVRGHARLYAVRPRSLVALYAARFVTLAALAFVISALIMPAFDLLILGDWSGPAVFALIGSQILVYGSICALLTVLTRADAWIALFLGAAAIVWDGLRRVDFFQTAPPILRDALSVLLPPQGALIRVENAFGAMQPIPWDAVLYIGLYAALALVLAGAALLSREI